MHEELIKLQAMTEHTHERAEQAGSRSAAKEPTIERKKERTVFCTKRTATVFSVELTRPQVSLLID